MMTMKLFYYDEGNVLLISEKVLKNESLNHWNNASLGFHSINVFINAVNTSVTKWTY